MISKNDGNRTPPDAPFVTFSSSKREFIPLQKAENKVKGLFDTLFIISNANFQVGFSTNVYPLRHYSMPSLVGINIVSNKCCLYLEAICMSHHIWHQNLRQLCMVYNSLMYSKRRKLRHFSYSFASEEGQWNGQSCATIDNQIKGVLTNTV
jgi:hypothetical protein